MATTYGAAPFKYSNPERNMESDAIGANSAQFTVNDPVTYASGLLEVATATSEIVGVAASSVTMASNNQTVAQVAPSYVPADENTIFLMGTNANLTGNATDVGTYYKLTGTTGVVQVDVVSGVQTTTSRVVMIKKVDPFNDGSLNKCLVVFVKRPAGPNV